MSKVLIILPTTDFDPSESSIPWKILKESGHEVSFGTPSGKIVSADPIMLTGKSLGLLAGSLMADKNALAAYSEMTASEEFNSPLSWNSLDHSKFDALIIPGGHAQGVKEMLENEGLKNLTSSFFEKDKIVGAVCHGVLLVARSKTVDGDSLLKGRKTTGLLKSQEMLAHNLTRLWKGDYYRTYPGITVEDEVKLQLATPSDFIKGPLPITRDSSKNLSPGFCFVDRNYISARWPGDCHTWAMAIDKKLKSLQTSNDS
ncbi:MAG: DJ-1/PfpI family protein [Bacteriovoracaceae bacterium]|nr:DJ-1/PfpI family protein [Bacteriovoracaceae bacterium]